MIWLLHETLVVEVKPPVFFRWTESRTELWSVVAWEPGDDRWSVQLCKMEGSPVLGARTSWPRRSRAFTSIGSRASGISMTQEPSS